MQEQFFFFKFLYFKRNTNLPCHIILKLCLLRK